MQYIHIIIVHIAHTYILIYNYMLMQSLLTIDYMTI